MEDIYKSINRITKTDACTKAYPEPRYNSISDVTIEGINEVSYNRGKKQYSYDKSHNSSNFRNNIMAAHTIGTKAIQTPTELPSK